MVLYNLSYYIYILYLHIWIIFNNYANIWYIFMYIYIIYFYVYIYIYIYIYYFSAKMDRFLVGYFNINILINNNKIKYFLDNIYSLGWYHLVTKSTRYGIHINSSIDNIYCNCNYKPIINDNIIIYVSDHLP